MLKKSLSLFLWIFTFQFVGFLLGKLTQSSIDTWYRTLHKSLLSPPDILFPIVWSILYVMLAFAGWLLWQKRNELRAKIAFIFYSIQLVMNWLWTPIFFYFHWTQLGFYWIVTMVIFTLITLLLTLQRYQLCSILLIPYVIWLSFASYLNWVIYIKN